MISPWVKANLSTLQISYKSIGKTPLWQIRKLICVSRKTLCTRPSFKWRKRSEANGKLSGKILHRALNVNDLRVDVDRPWATGLSLKTTLPNSCNCKKKITLVNAVWRKTHWAIAKSQGSNKFSTSIITWGASVSTSLMMKWTSQQKMTTYRLKGSNNQSSKDRKPRY